MLFLAAPFPAHSGRQDNKNSAWHLVISHVSGLLLAALWSSVGCSLHFTDKETEAHRGQVTWPKPHCGRKASISTLTLKSKALSVLLCF